MLRIFSFLPPIGCYALAIIVVAGTMSIQTMLENAGHSADSRIYVAGGILAFLLAFAGFQKSIEQKQENAKPRVSSDEVMQKLTPTETGAANPDLDIPPQTLSGPAADSPLGRVRARSQSLEV